MQNKVGILTFHKAISYGAVLQSYALQNFMFNLGIDNEIVDYKCDYMVNRYQKTFRRTSNNAVKDFLWSIKTASGVRAGRKTTYEFANKFLKMSRPYTKDTLANAKSEYKAFVTGSDQVWSPTCVGFDPAYFLTFADSNQKYSYAASIAVKKYPDNLKDEFVKRISDFQGCSVREKSGAEIVRELTGKEASVNIDPTLLLDSSDWDKIAYDKKSEPYIFLFNVLKPKKLIDYAIKLAEEKDMKILYLNNRHPVAHKRIEYLDPVTADKFIGLIKNAAYVCTNSFHGNAFSVIYGKKFIVETETAASVNIRSQELLEYLGLSDRILSSAHTPDIDKEYDIDNVRQKLEEERKKSAEYLSALK